MRRWLVLALLSVSGLLLAHLENYGQRGGGGRGGGGGNRGGGGGANRGGARPAPQANRGAQAQRGQQAQRSQQAQRRQAPPSMGRPNAGVSNRGPQGGGSGYRAGAAQKPSQNVRPGNLQPGNGQRSGGITQRPQPAGGMQRPGGGPSHTQLPGMGGATTRPGAGGGGIANRPGAGGGGIQRPGIDNRPGAGGGGIQRPGIDNRPGAGGGGIQRPGAGDGIAYRPGAGGGGIQRPGIDNRPGGGGANERPFPNRPGEGGGGIQRPGIDNRPGIANRPGEGGGGIQRPGIDNRPGIANRPGEGGGGIQRPGIDNRPGFGPDRPIINRPGGDNFVNRPINSNNNIINNPTINNINANRPVVGNHFNDWHGHWDHCQDHCHPWYNNWSGHSGNYAYWGAPVAWGMGAYGLSSLDYSSGYYPYTNPYYVQSTVVQEVPATNYAQPLIVQVTDNPPPQAASDFDTARQSFKSGDYRRALELTNVALKTMPGDTALHEFRALVLFALGQYKEAASAMYAVLSVGTGWDWTTMSNLYSSSQAFEQQMRSLEKYCRENPKAADAKFYLAYLYKTCGYDKQAVEQLQAVTQLQPQDQVSANMLKALQPADAHQQAPAEQVQPAEAGTGKSPEVATILGSWKAVRSQENALFDLTLNENNSFTWVYTQQGKANPIEGKFSYEGGVLFLEQPNGGAMMGNVTAKDNGFNFRMVGAPPGDTGLDFRKGN